MELNGPTWFMNDKEYTLDYVCANERGLQCVKGAKIWGIEEVVESEEWTMQCFQRESKGERTQGYVRTCKCCGRTRI